MTSNAATGERLDMFDDGLRWRANLLAAAMDLALFVTAQGLGVGWPAAFVGGFSAGVLTLAVSLNVPRRTPRPLSWRLVPPLILVGLLRACLLALLLDAHHWAPLTAGLASLLIGQPFVLAAQTWFTAESPDRRAGWTRLAVFAFAYALALRLVLSVAVDLLPEEAYYWMYAQHLDIGYLDHPPMVAWLIALGSAVAGRGEFGVRLPALLCGLGTAAFVALAARRWFGRDAATVSLFLVSFLPFWLACGLVMTPDAPLTLCWAAYLYFAGRALIDHEHRMWWPAGLAMGLGMLSKYTMALLGLATLVDVLLNRRSRRCLLRPEPWGAALLSLAVFAPVLIWNARHDWVSFAFQSTRRWSGQSHFSLHLLVLAVMAILTPVGAWAMIRLLWPDRREIGDRRWRFAAVFTLTPLAVFGVFSMQHPPKINWAGPLWLAALPLLAAALARSSTPDAPGRGVGSSRLWVVTAAVTGTLVALTSLLVIGGLPGLHGTKLMVKMPTMWHEFAQTLDLVEDRLEAATGEEPVLVGLDKYFLTSQAAFYMARSSGGEEVAGRHLLGQKSLMYGYWRQPASVAGRNLLVFHFDREDVADERLSPWFQSLGPIFSEPVRRDGKVVSQLWYRVGYGYRPSRRG